MDATDLTPDELLAADRLFAELMGEQDDTVADLAMARALRRAGLPQDDAAPIADAI